MNDEQVSIAIRMLRGDIIRSLHAQGYDITRYDIEVFKPHGSIEAMPWLNVIFRDYEDKREAIFSAVMIPISALKNSAEIDQATFQGIRELRRKAGR